jgi:hypothetical protein
MNHSRMASSVCASLLAAVLAASCVSTHDTADVVPSPPGAFQPDAGGTALDEATACAELTEAESAARAALGCDPVLRKCPDYIRPAGDDGCFLYDQASVDGCTTLYNSVMSCDAFDQRPCLLSAESCDAGSAGPGSGGAGGAGGQSGAGQGAAAGETAAGGASNAGAGG